eukprot:gene43741-58293_t
MMGLEEHLIGMFRGDAEFHEDAAPSHLGGHGTRPASLNDAALAVAPEAAPAAAAEPESASPELATTPQGESPLAAIPATWAPDAEKELRKIPFFVRGKARRNTEAYAQDHCVPRISVVEALRAPLLRDAVAGNAPAGQAAASDKSATRASAKEAARTPIRVVIVTMDSHLASAAERGHRGLKAAMPGLSLVVHAASEWGGDTQALDRCKADIAQGDIVLATMLFMEDHFLPVLEALQARCEQCDAMVCIMSAPQVTQLTRMGKLVMGRESGGLMALLKKLRPSAKNKDTGEDKGGSASAGSKQMAMLRRLPKLLRFIPGTAQDLRLFFLTMRYWLAGSEHNIEHMVRTLVQRYAQGPREGLRALAGREEPIEYPEVGVYHPAMKNRI